MPGREAQVRNEEKEKKEWIGQNGAKRGWGEGECSVYSGRQDERRDKGGSPTRGYLEEKGTSVEGGPLFSGTPAPTLHFLREAKSQPLLPTDWSTVRVHHVGGAGG